MAINFSRRDFLKLSALAAGSLAFAPRDKRSEWIPEGENFPEDILGVARVGTKEINVVKSPEYGAEAVKQHYRDELIPLFEEIIEPEDWHNSPRWYRTFGGYVHSTHLQRVDGRRLNPILPWIPEEGWLGEITVPFTRAYRDTYTYGWVPLYRLYYQSVHWATAVEEGPDGQPWYRLEDELLKVEYHIPAQHMRIIHPDELTPISPHVPWEQKRIEVSIQDQAMIAYEHDEIVLKTKVSTGIPTAGGTANGIPTATPTGRFNISVKMPSKHMGDGKMTDDIHAYELPGVPWVSFFDENGVAFHGTYWHDNFGYKMSHGCVNMLMEEAKWLYRWVLPETEFSAWETRGYGTRVHVF